MYYHRRYHGELPSDVSHGDTAREEYAREPGAYVQEVWRRVPGRQKEKYNDSIILNVKHVVGADVKIKLWMRI